MPEIEVRALAERDRGMRGRGFMRGRKMEHRGHLGRGGFAGVLGPDGRLVPGGREMRGPVPEQFLCFQPDVQVASLGAALALPEVIGGPLDIRFGGIMPASGRDRSSGIPRLIQLHALKVRQTGQFGSAAIAG